MRMSRRDFVKLAAVAGVSTTLHMRFIEKALAGNGNPQMIWLQGQGCSGCSVSLLHGGTLTTIDDQLVNRINLECHSMLIAAAGDVAFSRATHMYPSVSDLSQFATQRLGTGENVDKRTLHQWYISDGSSHGPGAGDKADCRCDRCLARPARAPRSELHSRASNQHCVWLRTDAGPVGSARALGRYH